MALATCILNGVYVITHYIIENSLMYFLKKIVILPFNYSVSVMSHLKKIQDPEPNCDVNSSAVCFPTVSFISNIPIYVHEFKIRKGNQDNKIFQTILDFDLSKKNTND